MLPLEDIFSKYKVTLAYLFGSQQGAGKYYLQGKGIISEKDTDLDLAVYFKERPQDNLQTYLNLYADLTERFIPFCLDLVFLHEVPIPLQYEAISGHLIYCSDEIALEDFEERVLKFASDYEFKTRGFEKDFLQAIEDGYFEIKSQ